MNEREGGMACAQRKDLPTALILFNVTGDGGRARILYCGILGGEGDSCPPLWGTVGKGTGSLGPLSPLVTA